MRISTTGDGAGRGPWPFQQAALELEREGLPVVMFPQSPARMIPASDRLYRAIVERRLSHPNDTDLNRHVASAVALDTPRGWRLAKAHRTGQIDAVVARDGGRAGRAEARASAPVGLALKR